MEKVQNRMSKLLHLGEVMRPDERNQVMKISSHQQRRLRGDLITIFKNYGNENLFPRKPRAGTRGNSKAILKRRTRTNIKKHTITHRSIDTWNSLPENVVSSSNLQTFKRNLDRFTGSGIYSTI